MESLKLSPLEELARFCARLRRHDPKQVVELTDPVIAAVQIHTRARDPGVSNIAETAEDAAPGDEKRLSGSSLVYFDEEALNDLPWFKRLKVEVANFSLGFQEVKTHSAAPARFDECHRPGDWIRALSLASSSANHAANTCS
jgi:hypothetical protein